MRASLLIWSSITGLRLGGGWAQPRLTATVAATIVAPIHFHIADSSVVQTAPHLMISLPRLCGAGRSAVAVGRPGQASVLRPVPRLDAPGSAYGEPPGLDPRCWRGGWGDHPASAPPRR